MKVLFLAHRLPFPPDRGDRIRSWNILQHLAERFEVHLGCLVENSGELQHLPVIERHAASHYVAGRSRPLWLSGLHALRQGRPVSLAAFDNAGLREWVQCTVREKAIDSIYVFSGQMGQFVPDGFSGRLLVDLVDVDSAKFESYALNAAIPMRLVHSREARLLKDVEADLVARSEHTFLVSENEAALLRSRLPAGDAARVSALRNGIDFAGFDPAKVDPHRTVCAEHPHFLFTGQMDYRPNVEAVQRFAHAVMPAIRAVHAQARFHIVGRSPTAAVNALHGVNGTVVHGEVPDMRPFLAAASVVVAPLGIARGVQNKVLEAMAMARPVLLTPEAATGIDAEDGRHFCIARSDSELVERALALLADRTLAEEMGIAARQLVCATLGWEATLAGLGPMIAGPAGQEGHQRDAA